MEKFWKITCRPSCRPLLVAIIYTIIDSFTDVGNGVMQMITENFKLGKYGNASAIGMVYFVAIMLIVGVVNIFLQTDQLRGGLISCRPKGAAETLFQYGFVSFRTKAQKSDAKPDMEITKPKTAERRTARHTRWNGSAAPAGSSKSVLRILFLICMSFVMLLSDSVHAFQRFQIHSGRLTPPLSGCRHFSLEPWKMAIEAMEFTNRSATLQMLIPVLLEVVSTTLTATALPL